MGLKINGIPVAGLGLPGRSAYQIAQDGGYQGSEAEFAQLLATAASQSYVGQKIGEHNQDESAHADIRQTVSNAANAAATAQTVANGKMATDFSNASAVLSAAKGGTGVTSLSELATALGGAKIETGSYIGDGTFGSPGKTLNFSFTPKMVLIMRKIGTMETSGANWHRWSMIVALYGVTEITVASYAGGGNTLYLTWGEKSLQYYAYGRDNLSAIDQLNNSATEYLYMALG